MFGLISKKSLVNVFAKELAGKQVKADHWYYVNNNQEMSSYVLQHTDALKNIATKLKIVKEVYNQAYKIYDFRNSGKKDFQPDINKIKELNIKLN